MEAMVVVSVYLLDVSIGFMLINMMNYYPSVDWALILAPHWLGVNWSQLSDEVMLLAVF